MATRLLYPIFLPFVAWGWLGALWFGFFAAPAPVGMTDPMSSNGFAALAVAFLTVLYAGVLQLLLGWPSWVFSRTWKSLRAHLALGGALGCALVILGAIGVTRGDHGKSVFKAVPFFALYVLPPFLAGYSRLYYLQSRKLTPQCVAHPPEP